MNKILILGSCGKIAGLTTDILYQNSPGMLRVASSREAGLDDLRDRYPQADVVQADWYDRSSLVAAMKNISRVLVVTPTLVTDENLTTPNIIAAAEEVGSIELLLRMIAMTPGRTVEDVKIKSTYSNHHMVAKPLLDVSGLPVCYVNVPVWIMFNLWWFFGSEVKDNRRIAFPGISNIRKMWLSENDIAAVMAKILVEPASKNVGREYVLTGDELYSYEDIARIFSEKLGEEVVYIDDENVLRESMGDMFELVMDYFRTESKVYSATPSNETVTQIMGRPRQTMDEYIAANVEIFR